VQARRDLVVVVIGSGDDVDGDDGADISGVGRGRVFDESCIAWRRGICAGLGKASQHKGKISSL
jgi:hypothetical protein